MRRLACCLDPERFSRDTRPHVQGAKEAIPARENGAGIGIRIGYGRGVMESMPVGRNHRLPQLPLQRWRDSDVGVLQLCAEQHGGFKEYEPRGRETSQQDGHSFCDCRECDLAGMKAGSRRHIKIHVHVVNKLEPPEDRHEMRGSM
jgi:hypothetical protein